MIRYLILLLLMASAILSHGQNYEEFYDTSSLSTHAFNHELIEKHAAESDFDYKEDDFEEPNLLEQFVNWLARKAFKNLKPHYSRVIYNWLKWILAILGIIVLVYYLRKLKTSRLLSKDDLNLNSVQFLDFEGNEKDLDDAWKQAEQDENFTLAMRLLFIKCLHHLRENDSIKWKKEKTNGDYLKELQSKWEYTPLARLNTLFAYSQYGGYTINSREYQEAKRLYAYLVSGKKGGNHES